MSLGCFFDGKGRESSWRELDDGKIAAREGDREMQGGEEHWREA